LRIRRAWRLTIFVAFAPACAIVATLWARTSVSCDKTNAGDFTKPEWQIAARNGSRCRGKHHAILAPMRDKPETPAKSISELLALFMRQAAVEAIAKRADVRRHSPARSK